MCDTADEFQLGPESSENVVVIDMPTTEDEATFLKGLADISRGDLYTVSATTAQEKLHQLQAQAVSLT